MEGIDPRLFEVFLEVQRGLPRQGPGNTESTKRALSFCTELPGTPAVLDIGCGPGMQTLALLEVLSGHITAVDKYDEYLDELRQRLLQAGLDKRIEVQSGDMTALGFPDASFDLIWSEGAAYIMGIAAALKAWRPLLRKHGYLAFTELVWLDEQHSPEVARYFAAAYPKMTTIDSIKQVVADYGFELRGDFTLPDAAWWDDYYTPLEEKLPSLRQKYALDQEALDVIAMTEAEIRIRRRHGKAFGYHFFVSQMTS